MFRTSAKALTVATVFAAAMTASATAQDRLKVAVPAFLSGPAAGTFGVPARNGAELVIDAINAGALPAPYDSAGFAGATVEAEFVDEAGGNAKQVAEYRNLIQKRGMDLVIGYVSSGSCAALAPVIEELRTLTVMAICGTPRIFEEADRTYIFRTMSHATADGVAAALYVKEMFPDVARYTGINQNYAFGQDSWRDFDLSMQAVMPETSVSGDVQFPKLFAGQYGAEISVLLLDRADLVHSSLWGGDLEGLIFQGTPRGLFQQRKFVLTVGDATAYRLGDKMPDGQVLGARGPYSILVRERSTPLNDWFIAAYRERYGEYPSSSSYQYAQAVLATKIAYDRAREAAGGFPSQEQVMAAMKGMEFESFSTHVNMALGNGHQAITEHVYGLTKYDSAAGEVRATDIRFFPAECINPPPGEDSVEWIKAGMPDAKC